ncbi:MAG TPA: hypothetical protein VFC40_00775 [Syntrophomonas sp.]|nr:hypothetical protein [Syntrophomonas sp.]
MLSRRSTITILIIIITLLLAPGCSSKSKDSQAKKPSTSTQQKPPPELKSILGDIEKIIADLSKQIAMDKKPAQQMQTGQSQSGQSQSGNQKGMSQSSNSSKTQEDPWMKLESGLKDIHKSWNKIEPEAIKAGLSVSEIKGFEQAIEKLTLQISKQNKMGSLGDAIELYGQYANLAKVFKSPVPADYYKTKYEIMAASVEATNGEWTKALERAPKIKDYWKSLKVQAKVKDEKIISRSEFSMDDFETALNSNNLDLLIIKAEIVLENLQQIEKAMSAMKNNQ